MNFNDWFQENKEILSLMYQRLVNLIDTWCDVYFLSDKNACFQDFVKTVFDEYVNEFSSSNHELDEESSLYFEMKYTEDITDLYIEFKNMSNNMCSIIFSNSTCTSDTLVNFIQKNIFVDLDYETDIDSDNEDFD